MKCRAPRIASATQSKQISTTEWHGTVVGGHATQAEAYRIVESCGVFRAVVGGNILSGTYADLEAAKAAIEVDRTVQIK